MCYLVFLSTTAQEDLSALGGERLGFDPEGFDCDRDVVELLRFPRRWFARSESGCSCTFRHYAADELVFGEPEDWYPESEAEVRATGEFYDVVARLVEQGRRVDCVSIWHGTVGSEVRQRRVDLARVTRERFRFFENHRFDFYDSRLVQR